MLERLQENAGRDRKTGPIVQPTRLTVGEEYAKELVKDLRAAKDSILIFAYAWRWYTNDVTSPMQQINTELVRAVNRGVDVRVICNGAALANMLNARGLRAKPVERAKIMHSKGILIDQRLLYIGSHNLTKRATTENYEMSIILQEPSVILSFMNCFETMWGRLYES